jgi:hypothetical protein
VASVAMTACLGACAMDYQRASWREWQTRDLKQRSVGHVGCPATEMTLVDLPPLDRSVTTFTLECRGRRFLCSQDGHSVACHEPLPGGAARQPTAAPTPTPAEPPLPADRKGSEWKARMRAADALDWP